MTHTAPATELIVDCFDVELYDGENLKSLGVGNYLELHEAAAGMTPGTWQVVAYHGEFQDQATVRPVPASEMAAFRRSESEKLAAIFRGNR
ncbi:hypothetical protein [Streptomyces sp900116325]|uniref:hypothetical protein n=1 Tax=Streptomyces sp. 900116325 TaxID=3154295 RepID=UPI0033C0DB73